MSGYRRQIGDLLQHAIGMPHSVYKFLLPKAAETFGRGLDDPEAFCQLRNCLNPDMDAQPCWVTETVGMCTLARNVSARLSLSKVSSMAAC